MRHTLDIFTSSLIYLVDRMVHDSLHHLKDNIPSIKSIFFRASETIDCYLKMLSRLSSVDFRARKQDAWGSSNYENTKAQKLHIRFQNLHNICAIYDEIRHLQISDKNEHHLLKLIQVCFIKKLYVNNIYI